MALKTRIQSFARDIELIVRDDLSPAAQQEAVAKYADREIRKTDETNRRILGRLPPRTVTVDGRPGAPLDSVNPNGGTIIAEWELVGEVLEWIAQALMDRSPIASGRYRDSHLLLADGEPTKVGQHLPNATEYLFINSEPYSRKIEVGKTKSGRDFVISVPNRIYERTARDARSRFGNIAKITFTSQSLVGGAIGAWAQTQSAKRWALRHRRPRNQAAWLTRQPAISVQLAKR